MTILHAQTLIEQARRAREDKSTRHAGNSTRDLFCASLVGYLRAYDIHCADELAVLGETDRVLVPDGWSVVAVPGAHE